MTYSRSVLLRQERVIRKHQNTTSMLSLERTIGPVTNAVLLIVLACVLGILYLSQVTRLNAQGYTINDLQQKQSQLQADRNDLEVTAARLQAAERIQSEKVAQNLVSVPVAGTVSN